MGEDNGDADAMHVMIGTSVEMGIIIHEFPMICIVVNIKVERY